MFSFLKKNESFKVVACTDGKCIKLSDVNDQVFSQKMMGDGFAIIPNADLIASPVPGTVEMIFPTKHAIGLKTKEGIELILHIGLDTVNLNGEGFTVLVKEKSKVRAGDSLVRINRSALIEKGYDLSTIVVFTNGYEKEIDLPCYGNEVKIGDLLIG